VSDVKIVPVSKIASKCVKGPAELVRHMRYAFAQGYPTLQKVQPHDGEAVLVGSGPSIADEVERIRALKEQGHMVCAIKGAHDFLIGHGIIPDMAVAVDPQEKIAELYRHAHYGVRYYMATQCHKAVFDALRGHKVVIWNVYTRSVKEHWEKYFRKKNSPQRLHFVNGGSTSGLRSIGLAWVMGYRKLHLFGYDSCLKAGPDASLEELKAADLKIGGVKSRTEDVIAINADDRRFYCDPAMALQANEFLPQLEHMWDMRLKAYGNGLIPWIVERAALRDMPQCRLIDEDWYEPSPLRGSLDAVK